MDKAKAAVSDFMHKAGHHDTTVHEKVAPAVTQETVTKHRHEEAQTAIDREVHQDHFHTSVQPVKDREVLPEQHHHNIVPVEHREMHHGDSSAVKARLEQESAQFQSTRSSGGTKESHSVAPVIAGEHVHHHVHETIQPVVQKETIQPSVVHTTVPIHEVHHNEAKHHASSALPAVSMADFKKQGGSLSGREERYDGFEGEPRAVGGALGGNSTGSGMTGSGMTGSGMTGHHSNTTAGPHGSNIGNKMDPRVDSDLDGSRNMGARDAGYGSNTTGTGSTGYGSGHTGSSHAPVTSGYGSNTTGTTGKKPGLMDKLNPMKDTDGDGKKGVME
ncbi:MAG: hypothetical protein LQ349_004439 [Xanthoria aureola]|nr:MAG: hypothetical protein LQ349_004439 [Xanthoria aureola]